VLPDLCCLVKIFLSSPPNAHGLCTTSPVRTKYRSRCAYGSARQGERRSFEDESSPVLGNQLEEMDILEVKIHPRLTALLAIGATEADFEAALVAALDDLAHKPRWELPPATQISLCLGGQSQPLCKLATLEVKTRARATGIPAKRLEPNRRSPLLRSDERAYGEG
jgi:hypothetical protein